MQLHRPHQCTILKTIREANHRKQITLVDAIAD